MNKDHVFNVAIVGLGFGAEFIPIYQAHPNANLVAVCQRTEDKLNKIAKDWNIPKAYTDYDELLKDPEIDIIHLNTPPFTHADMTVAGLRAGKHVGCTIPMALTVEDCKRIVDAQKETGKQYMMMETVVYSREFLYVKQLYDEGVLGKIQFIRGSHQQDMTGWPEYWEGLPPLLNATHAISPCLTINGDQAEYVECLGSGTIDPSMHSRYGSPFSVETTHIKFKDSDLAAEVTRSLYGLSRQYRESFDIYGSKKSFEWSLIADEKHVLHTGEVAEHIDIPDFADRLPKEIQKFTHAFVYDDEENTHLSFVQGSGHGGSHPHLVQEFLSALIEERDPYPDAVSGANITCSGILSHQSALKGGERIYLPEWTLK